jgi:hypothetical protein
MEPDDGNHEAKQPEPIYQEHDSIDWAIEPALQNYIANGLKEASDSMRREIMHQSSLQNRKFEELSHQIQVMREIIRAGF